MVDAEPETAEMVTAEAQQAVRRTVDDYAFAVDHRDDALYATLWAPGATLRIHEDGRTILARTLAETLGTPGRMRRFVSTMHAVVGHRATIHTHRAVAWTDCRAVHVAALRSGGHAAYEVGLRYDDVLVPAADGRWVFASRDLHLLWGTTTPAIVDDIFDAVVSPHLLDRAPT